MNEQKIIERLRNNPDETTALLLAHLRTPEKLPIYADALRKCTVGGRLSFMATWSWWAFFGGPFFFFYRKLYREGLLLAAVAFVLFITPIPFISFLVNIGVAVSAKYFYCKKFIGDAELAGYSTRPFENTEQDIRSLGGYNNWAIVLGVLFNIVTIIKLFILIGIVAVGAMLFSMGAAGVIILAALLFSLFKW